jgi:AhpD family alkylhydroperoxidase
MLNGCSFCLDMHTRNARKFGKTEIVEVAALPDPGGR